MGKRVRNPLLVRILTLLLVLIGIVIIIFIAIKVLLTSNSLNYNLGKISSYEDTILMTYEDYENFVQKYNIKEDLTSKDFSNNSYVASFQDYDKCSERKVKMVSNVDVIDNNINIKYHIYNKCGWCQSDKVVYLIKVDKLKDISYNINYEYDYEKTLNCGIVN